MPLSYCQLPLPRIFPQEDIACNQAIFLAPSLGTLAESANVRLLHRAKEKDASRFILSGKMADVCAALDYLARQEQNNRFCFAAQ